MKKGLLWILLIFLVGLRLSFFYFLPQNYKDGQTVKISGVLSQEPRYYDNAQLIAISGFRLYMPTSPKIEYGDYLVVSGKISGTKLEEPKLIKFKKTSNPIFIYRRRILEFFRKNIGADEAGLIAGMVLGSSELIRSDLWQELARTGTAHVVVASGMNISLIAGSLLLFFVIIIARRRAIFLTMIVIWLYVVFAGLNAPLIRAGIMGSLFLLSQLFGRQSHAIRLLFIAALTMLLVRPDWLIDLGFILSFSATLSLILFASKVERLLYFVPKVVRGDLSTSIAAQIFVAPILAVGFGYFNLLSPFVNMLVLWTVSIITVLGMLAGFVSLVSQPIARIFLLLEYPLASYFVFIVRSFANSGVF